MDLPTMPDYYMDGKRKHFKIVHYGNSWGMYMGEDKYDRQRRRRKLKNKRKRGK